MRHFAMITSLILCMTSASAWAEQSSADDSEAEYLQRLVEGHRLFGNNEHEAALRAYQAALEARPDDAQATYLIGCVHRAMSNLDEALESFQQAAQFAGEDNAALKARALMNVAFVCESQGELQAAREAWRAYITFAESHSGVTTFISNARQRLDTITNMEELDTAYGPVRQRIAEDENSSD